MVRGLECPLLRLGPNSSWYLEICSQESISFTCVQRILSWSICSIRPMMDKTFLSCFTVKHVCTYNTLNNLVQSWICGTFGLSQGKWKLSNMKRESTRMLMRSIFRSLHLHPIYTHIGMLYKPPARHEDFHFHAAYIMWGCIKSVQDVLGYVGCRFKKKYFSGLIIRCFGHAKIING